MQRLACTLRCASIAVPAESITHALIFWGLKPFFIIFIIIIIVAAAVGDGGGYDGGGGFK